MANAVSSQLRTDTVWQPITTSGPGRTLMGTVTVHSDRNELLLFCRATAKELAAPDAQIQQLLWSVTYRIEKRAKGSLEDHHHWFQEAMEKVCTKFATDLVPEGHSRQCVQVDLTAEMLRPGHTQPHAFIKDWNVHPTQALYPKNLIQQMHRMNAIADSIGALSAADSNYTFGCSPVMPSGLHLEAQFSVDVAGGSPSIYKLEITFTQDGHTKSWTMKRVLLGVRCPAPPPYAGQTFWKQSFHGLPHAGSTASMALACRRAFNSLFSHFFRLSNAEHIDFHPCQQQLNQLLHQRNDDVLDLRAMQGALFDVCCIVHNASEELVIKKWRQRHER